MVESSTLQEFLDDLTRIIHQLLKFSGDCSEKCPYVMPDDKILSPLVVFANGVIGHAQHSRCPHGTAEMPLTNSFIVFIMSIAETHSDPDGQHLRHGRI
jgi:hypothetical protein